MSFVHLHVHSHFSLLDGLPKIEELVQRAKNLGMNTLAITDHGSLYGAIEFYQKAREFGIKPIIGVEAYLASDGYQNKRPRVDDRQHHLILLAKNKTGYHNLIELVTKAHLEGFYYKPRMDHNLLEQHHEGLIALSSCLDGEIPKAILSKNVARAEQWIRWYQEVFGEDNFYLEIQPHENVDQRQVNETILELSKKLRAPIVGTNDVHYLTPDDAEIQDILLCLQTKRKKSDPDRLSLLGYNLSLASPETMAERFRDVPEAIENTVKIAESCHLEIEFGKTHLPTFPLPEEKSSDEALREFCNQGLKKRYGIDLEQNVGGTTDASFRAISERLNYELSVIQKTGFASYFLIVQDFVNWAKQNKIIVGPGRGSAAGSLVSYVLNITNIDPLKYDLLFERFLNPERISMPDIDIDFADTRRDEVIRYVEERYGKDHVAQIITFGTMAARAAVRDVGRVLGLPYAYCDRIAKLIPMFTTLEEAMKAILELQEINENDADGKQLLEAARKLEGVARHTSTHACGIVITPEPLVRYLPLQHASQDDQTIITQYSLHAVEDLGLLKMDFLGLKNLTIIENTIDVIKKTTGAEIEIDTIPLDDRKTFRLLQGGSTIGVFQLEGSGMTRYLKELKPTELEDIIAMVSLYRPGPMELIPDYIAGKHGKRKITYLHPKLEPILKKTYGIAIYQEQVLQIARDLCGFTLGEADVLRKAIGKKIKKLLLEQREKFIQAGIHHGISKSIAEKLFEFIEPFARYGFNRSHAACYAMIAYQTAFLKAHFPAEFLAALMTSDHGDTDRIAIQVEEAKRLGIQVLPPDVNESFSTFTVVKESLEKEEPTIRFGLMAIKNIGDNIVQRIIEERTSNGPYQNLEHFLRRVQTKDLNKKSLESLIRCGALDLFGERQTLLDNLDSLLLYTKHSQRETANGQINLFGMLPVSNSPTLRLRPSEPTSKEQRLQWEKELLGMYVSEHPLEEYRSILESKTTAIRDFPEQPSKTLSIGGIITSIQRILTKNQEPMLFVNLEDLTGRIEIIVFPKTLREQPEIWQEEHVVLITGRLDQREGIPKFICERAVKLNHPSSSSHSIENTVDIRIPSSNLELLEKLKSIFREHPGPFRVRLTIEGTERQTTILTKSSIDLNDNVIRKIRDLSQIHPIRVVPHP